MTRFVVVPQWQGSSSSRAMQLIDGAEAIAGDLPSSSCVRIPVPLEAGDALGTPVARLSALQRVREEVERAVRTSDERVLVVGGDCGVAAGALPALVGDDLAVVWLDAHPDLHTPATSPSGAFHRMVLRTLLGDGPEGLRLPAGAIEPSRVILAGTRAIDDEEQRFIAQAGIRVLPPTALSDHTALAAAVAATGAGRVYVHVALDVLDPSEIAGLSYPEPFGVSGVDLAASLRALRERVPFAGASLTEFSPASPTAAVDDLGTILRVVGALV